MEKTLSKELTGLVDWAVTALGDTIRLELGQREFLRIEKIRKFVKSADGQKLSGLLKQKKEFAVLSATERFQIAHSFALMLELINCCEAAYRSYRLRQEDDHKEKAPYRFGRVIHVLTAHPTESRSADAIYYFRKIQDLLERRLENPRAQDRDELKSYLIWSWRLPMSKQRKPTVMDEAEYIYSLALDKDVIDLYIEQYQKGQPFYIRTWVGGDKDGHPGVDEKSMLGSLNMSRLSIVRWLDAKFESLLKDMAPLAHGSHQGRKKVQDLFKDIAKCKTDLKKLKNLKNGDAGRVQKWILQVEDVHQIYQKVFPQTSASLNDISLCAKVFPGLVVPLEIREDSNLVHQALKASPRAFAISRMLKNLDKISPQQDPRFYVRGFILSQTESENDIIAGIQLVKRQMRAPRLPVVPLFESAHSLENSQDIVKALLKDPRRRALIKKHWSSKIEIMVGYSDSAKENGSWPSRYLIANGIQGLERLIQSKKFIPIFFHGSGGSIERGGGSVQEQTDWWPMTALETVKMTVQGETIYRNYAASEILKRQLQRFAQARSGKKQAAISKTAEKRLQQFAMSVQNEYRSILQEPQFLEVIELATPYMFMKDLRLGSRPAKRQGAVDIKSLRAIPWVLCWTQTRSLFPTWWGVGSFWNELTEKDKAAYKKIFQQSSLFRTYIKALGFTLEKVVLEIFGLYLFESKLPKEVAQDFYDRFKKELSLSRKAMKEITDEESLLWYRPWLETSISLRSPLIHPLNVLQLLALREHDVPLLRETVTGIASGMLTTG